MVVESWAIIVLILLISFAYFRTRRLNFAVSVLPLAILPFFNLISYPLSRLFYRQFGLDVQMVKTSVLVIAVVVSCLLYGVFAATLKKRKIKLTYLFTLILALVFLFH